MEETEEIEGTISAVIGTEIAEKGGGEGEGEDIIEME